MRQIELVEMTDIEG